jgi:uncharacterized protein
MEMLQPLLVEAKARHAEVELWFGPNDSDHPSIQGTVQADLDLICQRCLKAVPFRAQGEVRLGIVSGGVRASPPIGRMAPGFEPFIVEEDEPIALSDIIEEELLLMLPIAPRHPEGVCAIPGKYLYNPLRDKRENPFAGLVAGKPTHSNHEERHGCSAEKKIQR